MTYTIQYFIDKFSAIPDDQWRSDGHYGAKGEPHCVLGHLQVEEIRDLYTFLKPVTSSITVTSGITALNDQPSPSFPQTTPKARILAALAAAREISLRPQGACKDS